MPERYLKREKLCAPLMPESLAPPSPQAVSGAARPLRRAGNAVMLAALCMLALSLPAAVQPETMAQTALHRLGTISLRAQTAAVAACEGLSEIAQLPGDWSNELRRTAAAVSYRFQADRARAAGHALDAWEAAVHFSSLADDRLNFLKTQADSPAESAARLIRFITGRDK